jgi:hippurate hydrolase
MSNLQGELVSIIHHMTEELDVLKAIRRDIHAHPELGFEEHRTAALIAAQLAALGIEHYTGIGRTGVVGVIPGRLQTSGRAIGLRADMDALPLHEHTGVAHASAIPGAMHACGHDGHVAMLLAATRHLQRTRAFDGTVYVIFQPGEEGHAGAREMIRDGLFERFPAQQVYALHNWPSLPLGQVSIANGTAMAATDRIAITIHGMGGHGGVGPHKTVDPILIAGHVITAVNHIVSRHLDPLEAGVISLCGIAGGSLDGFAVIPDEVRIVGTARSLTPAVQDLLERRIREVVKGVTEAFGAHATVIYERLFPATINTPDETRFATEVAVELFGQDNVAAVPKPSLGGEDFSFMLQARPGAYIHLGTGVTGNDPGLHNPKFDFNDDAIPLGGGLLARIAEKAMPL